MKKGIGIGVEDFSEVIKENCYYIDKTKWIGEILEDKSKIKLFTRPRRFGKTLNMSMLKYFFNVENKEENKKLFSGLDIEKSEYMSEQGQYPVIFISLKSIKAKTWEEAIQEIRLLVLELFSEYKYLLEDLDEYDLPRFKKYLLGNADFSELKNALLFLTRILFQKYKKEVILLIDEYDSPLISAYEYHYYSDAIAFFKVFYGEALKTNQYLKMGVMTGIIRVIKAGIFSDLNNLNVYSILENEYSEFFGFNQDEVEETLEYFDVKYELFDDIQYRLKVEEAYNLWDTRKGDYDDYLLDLTQLYVVAIKGLPVKYNDFISDQVLLLKGNRVYTYTRQMIEWHKKMGHKVFFISGSPSFLVSRMAKKMGVDDFCGSIYEIDEKTKTFSGKILKPMWDSIHKQEAIENFIKKYNIDLSKSYAYGDTNGDFSMLSLVGNPRAINPSKELITRIKNDENLKSKTQIIIERKNVIYKLNSDVELIEF